MWRSVRISKNKIRTKPICTLNKIPINSFFPDSNFHRPPRSGGLRSEIIHPAIYDDFSILLNTMYNVFTKKKIYIYMYNVISHWPWWFIRVSPTPVYVECIIIHIIGRWPTAKSIWCDMIACTARCTHVFRVYFTPSLRA